MNPIIGQEAMGFFHGGDRERLAQHPQQRETVMERRPPSRPRPATQRQQIPGVQRMEYALQQVAAAQQQMREAADGLRAVLSIAPLAKAYAEFQDQGGGVSASDWQDWLDGTALRGGSHTSKRHLRLISSRIEPPPLAPP
jgi:hypothetical protein